ncbi:hypothetical protein E2562_008382 [Oryza meyeriana var. granulata]|uniref:Uncharacterized protein n=1 Tax=Oryza meyeriana var. granulata TaxID=110450 RepID=A0A6G1EI07_9ORYZ|nr:hypothetical protein E2562_008382 [Oryza meyeriana var. granulata]
MAGNDQSKDEKDRGLLSNLMHGVAGGGAHGYPPPPGSGYDGGGYGYPTAGYPGSSAPYQEILHAWIGSPI